MTETGLISNHSMASISLNATHVDVDLVLLKRIHFVYFQALVSMLLWVCLGAGLVGDRNVFDVGQQACFVSSGITRVRIFGATNVSSRGLKVGVACRCMATQVRPILTDSCAQGDQHKLGM